jgi:hypothetical protein
MKEPFRDILDDLPVIASRSRLEPYRQLIEELRQRGCSYRAIARVLADRCAVKVSLSSLYEFANVHRGPSSETRVTDTPTSAASAIPVRKGLSMASDGGCRQNHDPHNRITELRSRRSPDYVAENVFDFDSTEPLRLSPTKDDE